MSESLEKTKTKKTARNSVRNSVRKTTQSESKKRESKKNKTKISKLQSNESSKIKSDESKKTRILFLAIKEREKSLNFYESLCGLNGVDSVDSANLADLQSVDSPNTDSLNFLDKNLRNIFMRIVQKEREMLANARAIFKNISVDSVDFSVDSGVDSNADSNADLSIDSRESSESILLPSALPDDILGALLQEMGDLAHLNILALGVESHHLKTCDFLIKTAQQTTTNAQIIDILYQLQALSYNHHIPLLNGELPKENANPNANKSANQSLQPLLSDLLKQSPLLNEFKGAFDALQNIYAQTKIIVQKLERGELSKDELVAFLQKL